MLSSLFGFLSALTWGAGDFAGGLVSRRAGIYRAAFYGEATGMIFLVAMLAVFREPVPGWPVWAWSAAAGAIGSVGLLCLFRSLAEGQMSVAAPVSALMAAVLPVIASAFTEGLPGLTKYLGFGLAFLAIWLISQEDGHQKELHLHLADLRLPLFSGVCFGAVFHPDAPGQPHGDHLADDGRTRCRARSSCSSWRLPSGSCIWPDRRTCPLVLLECAGDIAGNTFYILSGQIGRLDVAAVLGSLYPGTTVLLAGMLLHERLNRSQWLGITRRCAWERSC